MLSLCSLASRKLYYSDWHRERPLIGRLNLDGTNKESFVSENIALPNGLVILHRRRELCWGDAGNEKRLDSVCCKSWRKICFRKTKTGMYRLERSRSTGRFRSSRVSVRSYSTKWRYVFLDRLGRVRARKWFVVRRFDANFYFSKKIHSVSINGGSHTTYVPSIGGSGKLYGIVALRDDCPPGK